MLKSIAMGIFVLLLSSCDIIPTSTPTDPSKAFTLAKLESTKTGTIFSSKLSGNDSNGARFTGSFSLANREQTMLEGISVIPQEYIISISGGKTSMTFAGTRYIDINGNLISAVVQTTGQTCAPVSPYKMPETVKIGDFALLPAMTCSDNTTQERNWRIEDAKNGNINFITNLTVKNHLNTIVSTADVISTIDGDGNIVAFKIVASEPAKNYRITLNVDKLNNDGLQN